jgi:hypothetical protein
MTRPFDPESSAKAREQSELQREHYIRKHADDDYWVDLARDAGVMLPMYYVRPSDAAVKSLLRKLRVDWVSYIESYGWETTEAFEHLNPRYSMRALSGLILELWSERRRMQEACVAAAGARGVQTGSAQTKEHRYPRGVAKVKRKPLGVAQSDESV